MFFFIVVTSVTLARQKCHEVGTEETRGAPPHLSVRIATLGERTVFDKPRQYGGAVAFNVQIERRRPNKKPRGKNSKCKLTQIRQGKRARLTEQQLQKTRTWTYIKNSPDNVSKQPHKCKIHHSDPHSLT